jgi:hypothetical protein
MATRVASDAGLIVVAAAGNGGLDLDSPTYQSWADLGHSGAIIVGAGSSDANHNRLEFSTYGQRVDLQGWGENVATTCCGDLLDLDGTALQMYTGSFNGTSSASPIVASAVVALSQVAKDQGTVASADLIRATLRETGVPQGSGGNIGPLPDVGRAVSKWLDDRDDPVVSLIHPMEDLISEEPMVSTHIEVTASDPTTGVGRVLLEINGEEVATVHDLPFVFDNVTFPRGIWTVVAKAEDLAGNVGESQPVTIYVQEDPPAAGSSDESGQPGTNEDDDTGRDPDGTTETGGGILDPSAALPRGPQDCRCRATLTTRAEWLGLVVLVLIGVRRRAQEKAPSAKRAFHHDDCGHPREPSPPRV